MTTIAIAGATGAVGQQMLECLKERNIQADLKLLASARSKGKEIDGHIVEELTKESFQGVDYVLGATGNDIGRIREQRTGGLPADPGEAAGYCAYGYSDAWIRWLGIN